jgi:hypothetical protein
MAKIHKWEELIMKIMKFFFLFYSVLMNSCVNASESGNIKEDFQQYIENGILCESSAPWNDRDVKLFKKTTARDAAAYTRMGKYEHLLAYGKAKEAQAVMDEFRKTFDVNDRGIRFLLGMIERMEIRKMPQNEN